MYALTVYKPNRRVGELNISLELDGGMKDVVWTWTGMGLSASGDGGWEESDDGRGYFLMLADDKGHFAYLYSKLWEDAVQNKYHGSPPQPWFSRHRNSKGPMHLLAVWTLPSLEWELF